MSVRQVRRQVAAMKLELTNDLVQKISLLKVPQAAVEYAKWKPTDKPNYLVYDSSRKAPPGFAVRVGARASVYLVEKTVRGKKLKIDVGLARGKRGGRERDVDRKGKGHSPRQDRGCCKARDQSQPHRRCDRGCRAHLRHGLGPLHRRPVGPGAPHQEEFPRLDQQGPRQVRGLGGPQGPPDHRPGSPRPIRPACRQERPQDSRRGQDAGKPQRLDLREERQGCRSQSGGERRWRVGVAFGHPLRGRPLWRSHGRHGHGPRKGRYQGRPGA